MARLWKKSLLLATSMVLPTFALTACAGDSQYGTVAFLKYNFDKGSNGFTDLNQEYGFNNWTDTDATFQLSGSNWKSYSSSSYVKSISQIAITVGLFAQNLVRASLVGFTDKTNSIPIFSNGSIPSNSSDKSNSKFLQFLYAASDLLNFGQANQIGFGLTGVTTTFSDSINPQEGGNLQVVNKDNKQLGYTNNDVEVKFTIDFGYWYTGTDSPTTNGGNSVKSSDIQNYVNTYNVWSQKFDTYYTTFEVQFNLKARIQSVFTMSDDWANATAGYQKVDNWTNNEYLYDSNDSNPYSLSDSDLNNFVIDGSNSNFLQFNIQFENAPADDNSSTTLSSTFLNKFSTYSTNSLFGTTTSGDSVYGGNYSTFESEYSTLNNLFTSSTPNFADFNNALYFVNDSK